MFLWDQALYDERLVTKETLKKIYTPGILNHGGSTNYGYGWSISSYDGKPRYSHTGATVGFRTAIQRYPGHKFTVVVLVNRDSGSPNYIASEIRDIILN